MNLTRVRGFAVRAGAPMGRIATGIAGIALLVGGVVAVFRSTNGGGSAALVTAGTILFLIAALGDRITAVEFGSAKVSLEKLADERYSLARAKEAEGHPEAAAELRQQGLAFRRLASAYAYSRRGMKAGVPRTKVLERIVSQLSELAREHQFDPGDVLAWFDRGAPEIRIGVIGLMHGDRRLRDPFVALEVIEHPRTAFEEYHGLRLAYEMADDLSPLERDWLLQAVKRARESGRFGRDTDRRHLSEALERRLSQPQPHAERHPSS